MRNDSMNIEILSRAYSGDWIQHPEFPYYYFCRDGRAASITNGKPRILSGTKCGQYGYRAIPVFKDHPKKKIYIHRTVCELFNGPPEEGQQCRHLDGNNKNNAALNLKWGSAKENNQDKVAHGTGAIGKRNGNSKLKKDQVEEIRRRVADGETQRSMCKIFNVSPMTISRVIRKVLWK